METYDIVQTRDDESAMKVAWIEGQDALRLMCPAHRSKKDKKKALRLEKVTGNL